MFKGKYRGCPCAAKVLTHHAQQMAIGDRLKTTAGIQAEALAAFRRECDFLESLKHDNIVRHLANFAEPNSNLPILVMELMDSNLKEYLERNKEKKLSIACQLSICRDVSKGIEFLHSKNIIHRDLCDVNILISLRQDDFPKAKVADFGMSRILPCNYVSATLTGLGHRQVYLPPEAPEDHYSYTLDIYSFGVIAVQIIKAKTGLKKKFDVTFLFENIPESHLLKETINCCLSDDRKTRPQASDIVNTINDGVSTTTL